MKKIQINIFSCRDKTYRFPMTLKHVQEISQCVNRDKIRLMLFVEEPLISSWKEYFNTNKPDFDIQLVNMPSSSYLERVHTAQDTDIKYSAKVDDDVLTSRHVWDFIIDNLNSIDKQHPIIAPIFSNGIPSVELFIKEFLDEKDLEQAYKLLLSGRVDPNCWGLNFNKVNEYIQQQTEWNGRKYWDFMSVVDTDWENRPVHWGYYQVRGVHPARFSPEFNLFIAEKIIQNKEKFYSKNTYSFEEFKAPYFTNNIFVCETEFWKKTLQIATDGWDEGQLSIQMSVDDATPHYIKNGFAIHMAYGNTYNQKYVEDFYINNFIK